MTSHPDDEALSWGDEADATHIEAAERLRDTEADASAGDAAIAPRQTGSVLLVAYGIFGGAYLLYIIGWVIAVRQDTFVQASLLAEIMYQFGEFLAIASPAVWIGGALFLTRGSKPLWRVLALMLGLLLTAPWPFILGGIA